MPTIGAYPSRATQLCIMSCTRSHTATSYARMGRWTKSGEPVLVGLLRVLGDEADLGLVVVPGRARDGGGSFQQTSAWYPTLAALDLSFWAQPQGDLVAAASPIPTGSRISARRRGGLAQGPLQLRRNRRVAANPRSESARLRIQGQDMRGLPLGSGKPTPSRVSACPGSGLPAAHDYPLFTHRAGGGRAWGAAAGS